MKHPNKQIHLHLLMLFIMHCGFLNAQQEYTINGNLQDQNHQPFMFASVALLSSADSSIIAGTVSGDDGKFELKYNQPGSYFLSASFVGFVPVHRQIELSDSERMQIGTIIMTAKQTELDEVVITADRQKAKQQLDKTTYYINSALQSASHTGVDIMQHIPGVRVDLLQNITLNGSGNILILVDGMVRDVSFLAQLSSDKIDRVEIKDAPGVEYNAEISGVINVILKQEEKTGMSGHIYASLPTADDEVFSFPSASLNYAMDKLTLYSSYNGGFSFFDIETEDKRIFSHENDEFRIVKKEELYQQNWSHKFHFGADYFPGEKNQVNVYGFISRFSNEQSGEFRLSKTINSSEDELTRYSKDDFDINTSAYTSVFFKHIFNEGTSLSIDAGYYILRSENRLLLSDEDSEAEQLSYSQPRNNLLKTRIDFRLPLIENLAINIGIEQNLDHSDDLLMPGFNYTESTLAAYISASYTRNKFQANGGMRSEYLQYPGREANENQVLFFPALHIKYSFSDKKNLRFSYTKAIDCPSLFRLNPNIQMMDQYASKKGNQTLHPSVDQNLSLEYSLVFGNSFLKTGIFYEYNQDVIEVFTGLKDEFFLEKEYRNLGNIIRTGINTSGSLKLQKNISIIPHTRMYFVQTRGNAFARAQDIEDKKALNFESSLSAMFVSQNDFAVSLSVQYMSPKTRIQSEHHEDAQYFFSLEKTFFKRLKAGITTAIPFRKNYTYLGYDISGRNFTQKVRENIQLSGFPLWFQLNYSFSSGKKGKRIERGDIFEEKRMEKGF